MSMSHVGVVSMSIDLPRDTGKGELCRMAVNIHTKYVFFFLSRSIFFPRYSCSQTTEPLPFLVDFMCPASSAFPLRYVVHGYLQIFSACQLVYDDGDIE